jgi:cytochrome c biogenesis protein CcdA/thiol-disulfide isomerase/thioredoxin
MAFLVISFVAGALTVLAPCVLPLLPVVIGSSVSARSKATPYIVVGSLLVSVILFTFLLKASTAFITVPPEVWTTLSGAILIFFGLTLVFPALWESLPGLSKLSAKSNKLVGSGYQKKSVWGDVIIGAALGPVFSTCSPTYFVILASVLPVNFALGTTYIFAYAIGLGAVLLPLALLGERFASRLEGLSDPRGPFKRVLGVLFIILGLMVAVGLEKKLEAKILASGFFDVTAIEQGLLKRAGPETATESGGGMPYVEISNPSGFVNTGKEPDGSDTPITIGRFVGKKVILVDFMTYSCINCQRTFPYINAWYDKYNDQGLEIIAIHTPEFAFEKDIDNVREAMARFGIKHPVVLDNDYGTWSAYGNSYWPRKYLIDIHGNIVYDHIGEGKYEETEQKIKELLKERAEVLGEQAGADGGLIAADIQETKAGAKSPETYFGSARNEFLANGRPGVAGNQTLSLPDRFLPNHLYLGGAWDLTGEYAETKGEATVVYRYDAKDVYFVADADMPVEIEVLQDGRPAGGAAGDDVSATDTMMVGESRLYKVIHNEESGEHLLELRIKGAGLRAYTFTFG